MKKAAMLKRWPAALCSLRGMVAFAMCLLGLLLWQSCEGEDRYSHEYPCNFRYNISLHPTGVLARALTNPGTYVNVRAGQERGVNAIYAYSNSGGNRDTTLITEEKENRIFSYNYMGANGVLIIGCSSTMDGLRAYDGQCPNCLKERGGVNYPLVWSDNGLTVTCSKCGRKYGLDTGAPQDAPAKSLRLIEYFPFIYGDYLQVTNGK